MGERCGLFTISVSSVDGWRTWDRLCRLAVPVLCEVFARPIMACGRTRDWRPVNDRRVESNLLITQKGRVDDERAAGHWRRRVWSRIDSA